MMILQNLSNRETARRPRLSRPVSQSITAPMVSANRNPLRCDFQR